jgi:transporter family-2 protein
MIDVVLASGAGALVVLSMSLNSSLGKKIGVFRAGAVNYVVGLAGALAAALVMGWNVGTVAPPWWAWTGGLLGVVVVVASNVVLPRVSVALSFLLIVVGQLGTGVVLDALRTGGLPPAALVGAALVVAGALVARDQRPTG